MGKHEEKEWAGEIDRQYKAEHGDLAHFAQTLDGLGLEDFPERDYFLEAGQLLREAAQFLVNISAWAGSCEATEYTGSLGLLEQDALALATRIDKLLAGEGLL